MANSFRRPTRLQTISSDIDYIMCIDENGSEALLKLAESALNNNKPIDPNDKYLTITGVIFTRTDYSKACFEVEQLKKKYWKDGLFIENDKNVAVCLHSRDIRRMNTPFDNNTINRNSFLNDLTNVLERVECKVISSSINVENYVRSGKYHHDIYNTAIQFLIERYIYATKNKKKGIIVLESRNQNQDKKILENINKLFEYGTKIIKAKEFQEKVVGVYFNKKWNDSKTHTYVGLEIADLFTYPIHKFVRSGEKDLSFSTIEKKLDKGIKKGIKIFP